MTSLISYFDTLSKFGYISYKDVYKLLVLDFVKELTSSGFSYFITEDDYKHLQNMLYCLFGSSCLIPYPDFKSGASIIPEFNDTPIRVNMDKTNYRITQNAIIRTVT